MMYSATGVVLVDRRLQEIVDNPLILNQDVIVEEPFDKVQGSLLQIHKRYNNSVIFVYNKSRSGVVLITAEKNVFTISDYAGNLQE